MIFKEQIIALAKPLVCLLNQNVNASSTTGLTSSKLFEVLSSTVLCLEQLGCVLQDQCIITEKIKQRDQTRRLQTSQDRQIIQRRSQKKNIICEILNSVSSMIFNLERWITTNYSLREANLSDDNFKNTNQIHVSQRCQNCRSIIEAVKIKGIKEEVLLCSGLQYYLKQSERKRKLMDEIEEQNFLDSSFWKCIDSQAYERQKHRLYPKADAYLTHWLAQQKLKQNKYYEIKETVQQRIEDSLKVDDFMIENLIQTMLALFKKHMGKKGINEKIKKLVTSLGLVQEEKIKKEVTGACSCICECGCHHLQKDQTHKREQFNQKPRQKIQIFDSKKLNLNKNRAIEPKFNTNSPQVGNNTAQIKQKQRKRLKGKVKEKVNISSLKVSEMQSKNQLKQRSAAEDSMGDLQSNESNELFKRQHTIKTEVSGKRKKSRDSNFQYFFAFDTLMKKEKGMEKEKEKQRIQYMKNKARQGVEGSSYQYLSQKYFPLTTQAREYAEVGIDCKLKQQRMGQKIEKSTSTTNLIGPLDQIESKQARLNQAPKLRGQRNSIQGLTEVKNQREEMERKRKDHQFSKINVKSSIKSQHYRSSKQVLPVLKQKLIQKPGRSNVSLEKTEKIRQKERPNEDGINYKKFFTEANDRKGAKGDSFRQKLEGSLQKLKKRKIKNQNPDSIKTAKRNRHTKDAQKLFSISDLELFGGLCQSFSFTKSREAQEIGVESNEFESESKQLLDHIKYLSLYRCSLYNTVMSFLLHPYQTVSNNEVLDVNVAEDDLRKLFVRILKLHLKKCGQFDCLHVLEFKRKIIFDNNF